MASKEKNELLDNLECLERERNIDRETLLSLIEESLMSAAHKAVQATRDVQVKIDRKTGKIQCFAHLFVVETVQNPEEEISLKTAQTRNPDAQLGDEVEWEVTPENFGRIAAQTAKQVIIQRLRQLEKKNICEAYRDQLFQLVTGEVRRVEHGDLIINFGSAEGAMRRSDAIPGEDYEPGDMITALLIEINSDKPGPSLYVSRAHTDFVARLFEREVSEIADKSVEVKAISREAGYRSKIAVFSPDPRVDPVGACVGIRGNRVKTIVRELGGEKVDIIQWDPDIRVFVTNALKPAKISKIDVDEEHKTVRIEVPEDQLSLSIGKKGQNARLATKLTGWRIDIVKSEQSEVNEDEQFANQVRRATEAIAAVPEIGEKLAALLVQNGFVSLDGIVAAESSYLADILDIDVSRAEEILAAVQRQLSK